MAVDHLCSENPSNVTMSPRISFSHDLSQSDINNNIPAEQRLRSISASSADFDFCIHDSFNQESTSAEELFSNGKILPTQVKEIYLTPKSKEKPPPPPTDNGRKYSSKSENSNGPAKSATLLEESDDQKQKSKSSFWQFKRSSSLNCGNGYARSLCPIPLLSRSNSTGSASSSKKSSSSKDSPNNKQHLQKTPLVAPMNQSQYTSSNSYQKPPLKKTNGYGGNGYGASQYGNGVRINPVLNVPSANIFGFGSIFSSNKEKNKKK